MHEMIIVCTVSITGTEGLVVKVRALITKLPWKQGLNRIQSQLLAFKF